MKRTIRRPISVQMMKRLMLKYIGSQPGPYRSRLKGILDRYTRKETTGDDI